MNRFLLVASIFLLPAGMVAAQDFKGQWKGSFLDKSSSFAGWGGDTCDYVLELEVTGNTVSGHSYTYFTDGGKKFYTICALKGFVDPTDKYIEVNQLKTGAFFGELALIESKPRMASIRCLCNK